MINAEICAEVTDLCDLPIEKIEEHIYGTEVLAGSYTCGNYLIYFLKKIDLILDKIS